MSSVVYLPVEVQKRELFGKLLLTKFLLDNGYEVVIGRDDKVKAFALNQKNGIYIDKAFFKCFSLDAEKLKQNGFFYCAWDEEGLITGNEQQYISQRLSEEMLKKCDLIFCWGKKQAASISHFVPELEKKIYSVGNPRMDLLSDACKPFYRKYYSNADSDYVLVNTNFLYTKAGMDAREKRTLSAQIDNIEDAFKYVNPQILTTREIKKAFVSAIVRLSKEYKGSIIVRPHPAEDMLEYEMYFKDISNIKVSKEGDIASVLSEAKCVIHNTCTTGLESFLAGVPTIAYLPNGLYTYEDGISNSLGLRVTTEDELLSAVLGLDDMPPSMIKNVFFKADNYEMLAEYLEYDSGYMSSRKIIDMLNERVEHEERDHSIKRRVRYRFYDLYNHYFKYKDTFEDKYRHITSFQVSKIMKLLEKNFGDKRKVKVVPVATDVYWIG